MSTIDDNYNYWLAHCEGYRVECPDGRVGTVIEVVRDAGETRAEKLLVGNGLLRQRLIAVDPDSVAQIAPSKLVVQLDSSPLHAARFQKQPARRRAPSATAAAGT